MSNPWDHLPQASQIDRIFKSIETNPGAWADLYKERMHVCPKAWDDAKSMVEKQLLSKVFNHIEVLENSHGYDDVFYVVSDPLTALLAYPDYAYMIDSDPGELAIIAKLGDPKALLYLPACIVLSKEKTK